MGRDYLGWFLYADDILLVSPSVSAMQDMINICGKVASLLDLTFNVKKSCIFRVGPRHKLECSLLTIDKQPLMFVNEMKYLGVTFTSGKNLLPSYEKNKAKFFRAFNAIYAKAKFSNELVCVFLLKTFCLPILLYASECFYLNKSQINTLQKPVNQALARIFRTYDTVVLNEIKTIFNLNVDRLIENRFNKFSLKYHTKSIYFSQSVCKFRKFS